MLVNLSKKNNAKTFSISPENFTGEKGKGGMATEGTGKYPARDLGQGWKISPSVEIKAGETFVMADYTGMGAIKHIWLTHSAPSSRNLVIRFYWDNQEKPSIEVPLGDFFANANGEFRQLSSLAVCLNPRNGYNCYWEMPFKKGFKITLQNISAIDAVLYYQIDAEEKLIDDESLYFHAQFRRVNPLPYKENYIILDNIKGNGQYVGTYLCWQVNNNGWWGEGEIKFYLDGDKEFPTICGTGTEDYFCGAFNFDVNGYKEFTTLYSGMYKVDFTDQTYKANRRFNMYRWHITDPIYFKEDIRVTIQALGWRSESRYLPLQDDIASVAFFYLEKPCDVSGTLPDKDGLEII